jgi:hypothetical protein
LVWSILVCFGTVFICVALVQSDFIMRVHIPSRCVLSLCLPPMLSMARCSLNEPPHGTSLFYFIFVLFLLFYLLSSFPRGHTSALYKIMLSTRAENSLPFSFQVIVWLFQIRSRSPNTVHAIAAGRRISP